MKISIIGTVGVPANYGGFETLTEQLVNHRTRSDIEYTIYCSSKAYDKRHDEYNGAKLRYIPLKANGMQSIPYDIVSLIKASRHSDAILILGISGCVFLPIYRLFSKKKLIINIDGLEHRREKWSAPIRKFLKYSESKAIRHGDIIITDNKGVSDYVKGEYGVDTNYIAYGGNHVLVDTDENFTRAIIDKYNLPKEYSLAICRIEPENNPHLVLEAFRKSKKNLVFVGNWNRNEYGRGLMEKYGKDSNIKLLDAIYDLKELSVLRANCHYYLHGHSAGGTNPSLVEVMFFGKPIIAYNVVYNRETTENKAVYFNTSEQLAEMLTNGVDNAAEIGKNMRETAERRYTWQTIAREYEELF